MRGVKEYRSVRIIMNLNFASFHKKKQANFLSDLSITTGCPIGDFRKIKFSKGCVIFEGEMDSQAALIIYQAYKKYQALSDKEKKSEDFSEIRKLVEPVAKFLFSRVLFSLNNLAPIRFVLLQLRFSKKGVLMMF